MVQTPEVKGDWMVTDRQVRKLMKLLNQEQSLSLAAAKSGMDEKTARKYRRLGKVPSEVSKERGWRTREDPFAEMWEEVRPKLELNPGLQAKTLFKDLQRRRPGKFQDGQLRTLQRRVKEWRALEGPPKEVFFEQRHEPGELGQSDFTNMNGLGVRIQGQPFDHLVHHFVLPYSNWEWGTVCFTESFESLSMGFQNALWKLGGAPNAHRTDRMSAAVHQDIHPEVFTQRYQSLLVHYGVEGRHIQASKPHENGDVEQRHHRLKEAVDQALMLRGSRDFESREDYEKFLERIFDELNSGRRARVQEELKRLRRLPQRRLESYKRVSAGVKRNNSTIRVDNNIYSVDSRLIGEDVEVRVHADELQVWYGQRQVDTLPRLRGSGKHRIQYRHIIDWLVRKPGAFEHYRYREELFPTTQFRMAYDRLRQHFTSARASKDYLRILQYAARLSESAVDAALGRLLRAGELPTLGAVEALLQLSETPPLEDVHIEEVELTVYDHLLDGEEEVVRC
jgi:hypothetical protein